MKVISKLALLLVPVFGIMLFVAYGQKTPAVNAILLTDSLRFVTASSFNQSAVAYHPGYNKYYSFRAGNSSFPLETWNATGGLSVYQTIAGIDSRGMWYNPNTNQLERNCYSNLGWTTVNLDATGNALSTYSMLFPGQNQPNIQSVGAYDYKTNTVLFYSGAGVVAVYSRNTATQIANLNLTGVTLSTINSTQVIYTGQNNYEIGLLDYSAKRILLFNRSSGVFTGFSQLPASAITVSSFRFSYCNDRVWLFNSATATWNSFYIWNEPLPVTLISFNTEVATNLVNCHWITSSEINNNFFNIERSTDGQEFDVIGTIAGAGNSTSLLNYKFTDNNPVSGISYYRLKQTDYNGQYSYSSVEKVTYERNEIAVYPTVIADEFFVDNSGSKTFDYLVVVLYNESGAVANQVFLVGDAAGQVKHSIKIGGMAKGAYTYIIYDKQGGRVLTGTLIFI